MKILYITSEWPSKENTNSGIFLFQQVKYLNKFIDSVHVFHFRGNSNLLNYLKAWFRLRFDKNYKYADLLHVNFGYCGLIVFPTKKPVILTIHGSDVLGIAGENGRYKKLKSFLSKQISIYFAKKSSLVIAVSEEIASQLPDSVNCVVLPGGVNTKLFVPLDKEESRTLLGFDQQKKIILFPSNPSNPVKDFSLAEETIKLLRTEFNIQLISLFNIDHEKVPIYMNASDVLLFTSLHEGSPTVIKEAVSCGLPIVSVDVGDVKHQINKTPECYVIPNRSPNDLASAVKKILINNTRIINNYELIRNLDEEQVALRIVNIYKSVLGGSDS